ncbi:MAG TPA: sodium:calcium antiporter [Candidatus Bathyarchaeia archaeon]|nr:sodium:calcium antiporter [Candidatus Bathyarchaeia archaeon]
MFEGLGLLGNAIILLASLIFLVVGSEFTIRNAVKISDVTGFGKTTIGFVLVGFATSLPELSVSVFAVANPASVGVSIGNVLGSNIVNIALILGVCILIIVLRRPRYPSFLLTLAKEEMGNLHFGLFIASIIPLALLYIGYASRFIGVLLVGIFGFYMIQLARANRTKVSSTEAPAQERSRLRRYALLVLAGASVVIATAFFIVDSSSFIAESAGIPRVVIGATIVAFGTSIPEFATSVSSARKGHFDLALGNIIGSGFINITLILGVALIASPLTVSIAAFSNLVMFSLIINLFLWYFLGSERISWREGVLLLSLYAVFLLITFGGSSITPLSGG